MPEPTWVLEVASLGARRSGVGPGLGTLSGPGTLFSDRSMEIWLIVGFVALWLVFQLWLGPKLGIPT
ncbi:MAG: hypothetical protein SNJ61_01395 [Fimbriimonadaceae bacterium]